MKSEVDSLIQFIRPRISNSSLKNRIFLWGGYLRDEVLGSQPNDIDIIIVLKNEQLDMIKEIISQLFELPMSDIIFTSPQTVKFKKLKVSVDIRIVFSNDDIFGELKKNIEGESDFTINTLLKDISSNEIFDIFNNAYSHLEEKKLICVRNDLDYIFKTYPVRILRLVRFCVLYNLKIPLSYMRYIKNNSYLLNFIEIDRIRKEYDIIKKTKKGEKILTVLGINPSDSSRQLIFLGENWSEIEPGECPNRIIEGDMHRWSYNNSVIYLAKNAKVLKMRIFKHPSIGNTKFEYVYGNGERNTATLKNGINDVLIDCSDDLNKHITIITDYFIPALVENSKDYRKLGICFKSCVIYTDFKSVEYSIKNIPVLI